MKRLTPVTMIVLFSDGRRGLWPRPHRTGPAPTAAPAAATKGAATAAPAAAEPTKAPEPTRAPAAAPAGTGVGASAEGAASKGLTCLADAYNGKMKGTKVSMTGPFSSDDEVKFQEDQKGVRAGHRHHDRVRGSKGSRPKSAPRWPAVPPRTSSTCRSPVCRAASSNKAR